MTNAVLLALVAIVPLVVLTLTSFVKLSVVLSLVRNAIGAPDAPSGLVITGLSLVLTFFVMAPVAIDMAKAAQAAPAPSPTGPSPTGPLPTGPLPTGPSPTLVPPDVWHTLVPQEYQPQLDALERGVVPLRDWLAKHAGAKDRATFTELAKKLRPTGAGNGAGGNGAGGSGAGGSGVTGDELWVVAPAFVTTELRQAFLIAVLIFIPFVVIDLVVALGLASLGLASTSPQTVALPLKLMLFVAVDGWRLLLDSLLRGYA